MPSAVPMTARRPRHHPARKDRHDARPDKTSGRPSVRLHRPAAGCPERTGRFQGSFFLHPGNRHCGGPTRRPYRNRIHRQRKQADCARGRFRRCGSKEKARSESYVQTLQTSLRTRFPAADRVRIGNLLFGYSCAGMPFAEMATRDADGSISYQFDETLDMLDLLVRTGTRPILALGHASGADSGWGESSPTSGVRVCQRSASRSFQA